MTLEVPVQADEDFLGRGLMVPALPDGSAFESDANFTLDAEAAGHVRIDRGTRASAWESGTNDQATEGTTGRDRAASELLLDLVDCEEAYLDLIEHRRVKGMRPLAVPRPQSVVALDGFDERDGTTETRVGEGTQCAMNRRIDKK